MRLILASIIIGVVWINAIFILLSNGGNDEEPRIKNFLMRIENLFTFRKIMDPYNPRMLWTPSENNNYFLFMRSYTEKMPSSDEEGNEASYNEKILLTKGIKK